MPTAAKAACADSSGTANNERSCRQCLHLLAPSMTVSLQYGHFITRLSRPWLSSPFYCLDICSFRSIDIFASRPYIRNTRLNPSNKPPMLARILLCAAVFSFGMVSEASSQCPWPREVPLTLEESEYQFRLFLSRRASRGEFTTLCLTPGREDEERYRLILGANLAALAHSTTKNLYIEAYHNNSDKGWSESLLKEVWKKFKNTANRQRVSTYCHVRPIVKQAYQIELLTDAADHYRLPCP